MRAAVQSQRGGDIESSSPKSGFAMRSQKGQPAEAATLMHPSASAGSMKNMDASNPARKAHAHEIHEKAVSISNTFELPWPVRGDMKKRLPTKPVWGRTAPVCSVELSGCASSWQLPTAARRLPNMMATSVFKRSWARKTGEVLEFYF